MNEDIMNELGHLASRVEIWRELHSPTRSLFDHVDPKDRKPGWAITQQIFRWRLFQTARAPSQPRRTPMNNEVLNSQNRLCCQSDNFEYLCDKCKATVAATQRYLASDPYGAGIAALRAATGVPEPTQPDDTDTQLRSMAAFREQVYGMARTANLGITPATGDVYANPPDPDQPHLDARRKEIR